MKYFWAFLIIILIAGGFIFFTNKSKNDNVKETKENVISNMKILSSVFEHNQNIPSKYSCDGENVNPPLRFIDIPSIAKSLALIVDDPDAPMGTWVHWVVYNIDPKTTGAEENNLVSTGIQGNTSFGRAGYGGPCPPSGKHRYFFKLYALDTILDIPQSSDKKAVTDAIKGHIIAKSELIGLYSRSE